MDEPSEGIFPPKSGHFSLNFEKGHGRPPSPSPSGYAPGFNYSGDGYLWNSEAATGGVLSKEMFL